MRNFDATLDEIETKSLQDSKNNFMNNSTQRSKCEGCENCTRMRYDGEPCWNKDCPCHSQPIETKEGSLICEYCDTSQKFNEMIGRNCENAPNGGLGHKWIKEPYCTSCKHPKTSHTSNGCSIGECHMKNFSHKFPSPIQDKEVSSACPNIDCPKGGFNCDCKSRVKYFIQDKKEECNEKCKKLGTHGHCTECGLLTQPIMDCKCAFRNSPSPDIQSSKWNKKDIRELAVEFGTTNIQTLDAIIKRIKSVESSLLAELEGEIGKRIKSAKERCTAEKDDNCFKGCTASAEESALNDVLQIIKDKRK